MLRLEVWSQGGSAIDILGKQFWLQGHQKIGEVSHSTEVQVKIELDIQWLCHDYCLSKFKMPVPPGCLNESKHKRPTAAFALVLSTVREIYWKISTWTACEYDVYPNAKCILPSISDPKIFKPPKNQTYFRPKCLYGWTERWMMQFIDPWEVI